MFQNNNRAAVKHLAKRSFAADKSRNGIAAAAIALTALLFTSLVTMGFGMVESMWRSNVILSGGEGHARIQSISESEYRTISRHPLVSEMAYCQRLAERVENQALQKRHTEFWYYDALGLNDTFMNPTSGRKPQTEKEVITDTKTLELLGVPQKVGSDIRLELTVGQKRITRNFVLSGWWNSYPGVPTGTILASKAYVDAHAKELNSIAGQPQFQTGTITGIVKFADSKNISQQLAQVIKDSGFSTDAKAANYVNAGVNPLYLSRQTVIEPATVIALLCALLLFAFTGYLIIYNIFQISVLRDIHFYGLLKTIGTTKRQLYAIVDRQAWMLSAIGLPLGLGGGFFVGKALLPALFLKSRFAGSVAAVLSPNPFIFIAAALFTLLTVLISTRKPARMAAKVSPMGAVRFSEIHADIPRRKRTRHGAPASKIARASLSRNKRRVASVVLSLSLSIVLTNTIFTFANSVDPQKALENASISDFNIGQAKLLFQYQVRPENALSDRFIHAVEQQEGFQRGGRQYGSKATYTSQTTKQTINRQQDGSFSTHIYGMDPFPFSRLKRLDGTIDPQKLATGKYVLEGVWVDSRGKMDTSSRNHRNGEQVRLQCNGRTQVVTVLGHVVANEANTYDWVGSCFFFPGNAYKKVTGQTNAMSYAFDVVKKKQNDMEHFLKQYTSTTEPTMGYHSKLTALAGVIDIKNTIVLIGGTITFIIGMIGVLNFINTSLTSILIRRRELAVLQSIGMTGKQRIAMLVTEGIYYAVFTAAVSALLSVGSSLFIVRPLCRKIWFLHFQWNFWPLAVLFPLLFGLAALLPYASDRFANRQSLIKQLGMKQMG